MIILPEPANRLTEVAPSKSADLGWPCASRGMIATLPIPSARSNGTALAWSGDASREVVCVVADDHHLSRRDGARHQTIGWQ